MLAVEQIAIVGTGLLGGSIGLGLRQAGYRGRILGVGRRQETLDAALKLGCIDSSTLDLAQAAAQSQLLVLGSPLSQFPALLGQLGRCDNEQLIITDVGSTKAYVLTLAKQLLSPVLQKRFVGAHPMAGAEQQGPAAARADLFQGKPCILCSESDTDTQALQTVRDLWRTLGMRLLSMSAAEHDRQVALASHLPHALAAMLVEVASAGGALDVASTGFASTTRIASGDPALWSDIFSSNRPAVLTALDQLQRSLVRFRDDLASGDRQALERWLTHCKQTRDQWLEPPPAPEEKARGREE